MAGLSSPRVFYGVHSVSPYSRADGTYYGIMKVLMGSSLSLAGDLVELTGGSNKYPWAIEEGLIKAEMDIKVGQFQDFMFQLFLGMAPTAVSPETSGNLSAATNNKGTSVVASTGILSSLTSTTPGDFKFGKYVIVVASSTTVDVYLSSDADIGQGTDASYQNDALKITASALTIVQSTGVLIPNTGITLTGGSGTIGMTTGDTATFSVRPPNAGAMTVRIGGVVDQFFPEFGAIVMAQRRGNNELLELDVFRCKAAGMPLDFQQNKFSETSVKVKCMYDSVKDGVFDVRFVQVNSTF